MSRRFRPLSMTWVSPDVRGLDARGGSPRNPSALKLGNDVLQSLLGPLLHVVEERVAVRVDTDPEGAEVLDAELPEALGHQILPGDLLDLLDLCRLEGRRAADDREVHHPVLAHRLDRVVREAALAADRANAVLRPEPFGEAHHPGARCRPDADLLVATLAELADAGRRVQQEGPGQIHRRLDALVEDSDVRAVADADDVAVDRDEVAGAELPDLFLGGGECQAMLGHHASRSYSISPSAEIWAEALRAAQH